MKSTTTLFTSIPTRYRWASLHTTKHLSWSFSIAYAACLLAHPTRAIAQTTESAEDPPVAQTEAQPAPGSTTHSAPSVQPAQSGRQDIDHPEQPTSPPPPPIEKRSSPNPKPAAQPPAPQQTEAPYTTSTPSQPTQPKETSTQFYGFDDDITNPRPTVEPTSQPAPQSMARISVAEADVHLLTTRSHTSTHGHEILPVNAPVVSGDLLQSSHGYAELEFSGQQFVRLAAATKVQVHSTDPLRIEILQGTLEVATSDLGPIQVLNQDADIWVQPLSRVRIDFFDGTLSVSVREGHASRVDAQGNFTMQEGLGYRSQGSELLEYQAIAEDRFDTFTQNREQVVGAFRNGRYAHQDSRQASTDRLENFPNNRRDVSNRDWEQNNAANEPNPYDYFDNYETQFEDPIETVIIETEEESLPIGAAELEYDGQWGWEDGVRVWYPQVAADWRPYSDGHWRWRPSYGWIWVSNLPWGYVTHHYGRWRYSSRGWGWVPGRRWAPAHVWWGRFDGQVGWSPIVYGGPSVALRIGTGAWSVSARIGGFRTRRIVAGIGLGGARLRFAPLSRRYASFIPRYSIRHRRPATRRSRRTVTIPNRRRSHQYNRRGPHQRRSTQVIQPTRRTSARWRRHSGPIRRRPSSGSTPRLHTPRSTPTAPGKRSQILPRGRSQTIPRSRSHGPSHRSHRVRPLDQKPKPSPTLRISSPRPRSRSSSSHRSSTRAMHPSWIRQAPNFHRRPGRTSSSRSRSRPRSTSRSRPSRR